MAEIRTKRAVMRRKKETIRRMFFSLLIIPVLYLIQYIENNNDGARINIPWWIPVMIVVGSLLMMFVELKRLEEPDEEKSTQDKVE